MPDSRISIAPPFGQTVAVPDSSVGLSGGSQPALKRDPDASTLSASERLGRTERSACTYCDGTGYDPAGSLDPCNTSYGDECDQCEGRALDVLRYLADPDNWLGDPLDQTSTLHGHFTPYEMGRDVLAAREAFDA